MCVCVCIYIYKVCSIKYIYLIEQTFSYAFLTNFLEMNLRV